MKRIRGKTQRAIAWVLVIVTGVFIPGLTITTHICYARNVREVGLFSTHDRCCDKERPPQIETDAAGNLPACCAASKGLSCTENTPKSDESSLLDAQAESNRVLTKVKSVKTANHCCEKDVKVFQIKDSFRKAEYNKEFSYASLLLMTPGLYFVFPPEVSSLKFSTVNAPPLPYGKALCYLYQILLN